MDGKWRSIWDWAVWTEDWDLRPDFYRAESTEPFPNSEGTDWVTVIQTWEIISIWYIPNEIQIIEARGVNLEIFIVFQCGVYIDSKVYSVSMQ